MSKMTLYLKADGDELKLIDIKNSVYTGNVNSYSCEIDFSSEWEDLNAFALFYVKNTVYTVALLKEKSCIIPNEVLEENGEFSIGLYATNGETDNLKRISTGFVPVKVEDGCFTEGLAPQAPSADVWEQLISKTVPYIGDNKNWYVYDINSGKYTDTGISAVYDDCYTKSQIDNELLKKVDKVSNLGSDGNSEGGLIAFIKDGYFMELSGSDYIATMEYLKIYSSTYGFVEEVPTLEATLDAILTRASKKSLNNLSDEVNKKVNPSDIPSLVRKVYPVIKTSMPSGGFIVGDDGIFYEDAITVNTIYDLGVQTALTITLPSGQIGDFIQFDFISGETATTLTINSSSGLVGFDLIPGTNTIYTLYFDWGETGLDGTDVTYGWRFNYSEYSITIA
ncbi:MAG: hypothetical protein SOZ34_07130 [Clostridia bacterium]|nr:hypothetical protein [Clostridia bacterium]